MSVIKQQTEIKTEFSEDMKAHLLRSVEADPKFSEAHCQLALMYQENGKHNEAETHFKKAIESDSEHIREIEKRSAKLLKIFQFQYANILFMKAHDKRGHCAKVYFQLSNLYECQNQSSQAQTCLKNSIQLNPTSSKAHRNLGILLSKQKIYDVARIHIEKALELDYSDCISHFNLGMIMKKSEEYIEAELHLLIALDINPNFVDCLLEIALLYLVMNDQIKAYQYYQKAREISPDISHAELDTILR